MSNAYPLVSVVVLSYDRPESLKQSLDSIVSQSYGNLEVIVVDNKSKSSGKIAKLLAHYPTMRLVANRNNLGFTGGMNRGLREASGTYVYFTEDDLIVEENCISTLVEYMERNPSTGLASPIIYNNEDNTIRCAGGDVALDAVYRKEVFGAGAKDTGQFQRAFDVNFIAGAAIFGPLELLRRLNGFREDFFMYSEDHELCLRVLKLGLGISVVPGAKVFHCEQSVPALNPTIEFHKLKNFFCLYLLHAPVRVLPEFYLRYGVINFLRALGTDGVRAWSIIKAFCWFAFKAPSLIVERRRSAHLKAAVKPSAVLERCDDLIHQSIIPAERRP